MAETTRRLALLQKAHPSLVLELVARAQGQGILPQYPGFINILYRYFFGGFHHQDMIEGLFAATRWVDNGHLLPATLQARTHLTNNATRAGRRCHRGPS